MTKFEQIGISYLHDAANVRQANASFRNSCEICCNRGFRISCDRCAINEAHKKTVAYFASVNPLVSDEVKRVLVK